MKEAVAIVASLTIASAAIGIYCDTAARMDVNQTLPQEQRLYWWSQTFSTRKRIYRKYRELFPASRLPLIGQCAMWIALICYLCWGILGKNS
jgi:hypothetical protein